MEQLIVRGNKDVKHESCTKSSEPRSCYWRRIYANIRQRDNWESIRCWGKYIKRIQGIIQNDLLKRIFGDRNANLERQRNDNEKNRESEGIWHVSQLAQAGKRLAGLLTGKKRVTTIAYRCAPSLQSLVSLQWCTLERVGCLGRLWVEAGLVSPLSMFSQREIQRSCRNAGKRPRPSTLASAAYRPQLLLPGSARWMESFPLKRRTKNCNQDSPCLVVTVVYIC